MSPTSGELTKASRLPAHEAIRLLVSATGYARPDIVAGTTLTDAQVSVYRAFEERRVKGEPLQYIEGDVPFGSVSIRVDKRALIPRPETEEMFHVARDLADDPAIIVDLCTGSGNLAVALAAAFPNARVYATEISPDAARLARANVEGNGVDATILDGDLFGPLPAEIRGRIDLIVSNPPYLSEAELVDVPQDVQWEPAMALVGGPLGTEVLERIARVAPSWLAPSGVMVCEISEFDSTRTLGLFSTMDAALHLDMYGKHRFVVAHARFE